MKILNRRKFLRASLVMSTALITSSSFSRNAFSQEKVDTSRVGILMDTSKCISCQQCVRGCNRQFRNRGEDAFLEVKRFSYQDRDFFKRVSCKHCEDAACIKACPTKALYKGENGFTYVDRSLCIGCRYCSRVCPFDIIKFKNGRVSKCVGCQPLLEQGKIPRCVRACPVKALSFGKLDEMETKAIRRAEELQDIFPDAQIYGENQLGGLGVKFVLTGAPAIYSYPDSPQLSVLLDSWRRVLHPGGLGVTAVVAGFSILAFGAAKRNYLQEESKEGDKDE